jgi:hypothetical protein
MTGYMAGDLLVGFAAVVVGSALAFNVGGAAERTARFHANPKLPSAWRRNSQDQPHTWRVIGVTCLAFGLVLLATGLRVLVGR